MSRVLVVGPFVIYIYENDHGPPHVHVFVGSASGAELEVELHTQEIVFNEMNASESRRALRAVRENLDFLKSEWERIDPKLNQW